MTEIDGIRQSYENIPYPKLAFSFAHPGHTGAIAKLFGHCPINPKKARILEVGCGYGSNLLWIAQQLPQADCLGIDLAQIHIDEARQQARKLGVKNIKFERVNLLDYNFSEQHFDYIIAQGFFSWVPDEVKEKLLEICRDHLSDQGIALISYNCYPGWTLNEGLRLLMQMEQGGSDSLLPSAEKVLSFFEQSLPAYNNLIHAPLLKAKIQSLRQKKADVLVHDELGSINDPCYFIQFIEWIQELGLQYIGDTDPMLDCLEILPQEVINIIVKQEMNRFQVQQYLDFLNYQSFRCSLICKSNAKLHYPADPLAIKGMWVRSCLMPKESIIYRENQPIIYTASQEEIVINAPLIQGFLYQLSQGNKNFLPVDKTLSKASKIIGTGEKYTENQLTQLGKFIIIAQAKGYVELSLCKRDNAPNLG